MLSICDSADVLSTLRIVKIIIQIIKIIVPIILIVTMAMSYTKAVASNDNDALKKAHQSIIKKGIAAAVIFLVPTLVGIIAKLSANNYDYMKCIANANSDGIDRAYTDQVSTSIDNLNSNITSSEYNRLLSDINKIKNSTIRDQELKKLNRYMVYALINDGLANLVNNNTEENRKKVQDEINKLSDSDPQKKVFQDKLNQYSSGSKKPGVNLGIASGYYKGHNGSLDYYVYFPPEATTNMPVILWLHGDNPRIEWIKNNHVGETAYKAGVPAIMIEPYGGADFGQRSNPGWAEGGLLPNLKNIVEEVCNKYSCDRSNINIGGHSRGAIGTWLMVSKYPNYFHAAAPVSCCAYGDFKPQSFSGMKVWAWRGSNKGVGDDNDNIYGSCMQSNVNAVKPYAKVVKYTIQPNTTHGEATDKLQRDPEFVKFIFSD